MKQRGWPTIEKDGQFLLLTSALRRATEFYDEVWEKSIDISEKPTTFTFKVRKRDYDDGSSPIQNVSIFLPHYTASRIIFINKILKSRFFLSTP